MASLEAERFCVHDFSGLKLQDGSPGFSKNSSNFSDVEGAVKLFCFSENGKRVAWIVGGIVYVREAPEWKQIGSLQHPKAQELCFSPQGNYLAIWETFSQSQAAGAGQTPNLSIYDVGGKRLLKAFVQKSQIDWKPQWTKDETVMARLVTSEIHFYKGNNLETYEHKKVLQKVRSFSLSPSSVNHYVTFFVPSLKAAPAFVQLFKYPSFKDNSSIVASKSFFKVDSIEPFWNATCSAVLLLTTAEVDKTGSSYYGEQMLFYLNTRGNSERVTFSKQGSIRSVAWLPNGREFAAVYGMAPAKAAIFNLKCDPVKEFGENARNIVIPNPVGNIIMIGGLGNISSRFEFWDVDKGTLVGGKEVPDITHMEWSPCGQFLLTSTCSPRLRVNNGYKIYHYTGALVHEQLYPDTKELFRASWVPSPDSAKAFEISFKPVKSIQSQTKTASNFRYVPPSRRDESTVEVKKFLSQRNPDYISDEPKMSEKAKKKKEATKLKKEEARKKKEETKGMHEDWRVERKVEESAEEPPKKLEDNKTKRAKNIKKKLESIQKLKADMAVGKYLDPGQLTKIDGEQSLIQELELLTTS